MSETHDLAIIGAGSAGITAARFAASVGARVALIEGHRIGGDCTWTGCVPSKALLKAARVAHEARHASNFGLNATAVGPVNLIAVMKRVDRSISQVYRDETPEVLRQEGIDVRMGRATFRDAHTLVVASTEGETINEWALAISRRLKLDHVARTVHVYPTYSIANQQLASTYVVEKFLTGRAGKLLKRFGGLR